MQLVKTIKNVFKPEIACPCGFKSTSRERAVLHLNKHPNNLGFIDENTGSVIW